MNHQANTSTPDEQELAILRGDLLQMAATLRASDRKEDAQMIIQKIERLYHQLWAKDMEISLLQDELNAARQGEFYGE